MNKIKRTTKKLLVTKAEESQPLTGLRQGRMTRQRRVILEQLRALKTHPTADELYMIVRRELPRVSLGTVYRNLDVLHKQGEVLRLAGPQTRFDGNVHEHYHVRCVKCGKVRDVEVRPVADVKAVVRDAGDFEILGMRVEFVGRCSQCR